MPILPRTTTEPRGFGTGPWGTGLLCVLLGCTGSARLPEAVPEAAPDTATDAGEHDARSIQRDASRDAKGDAMSPVDAGDSGASADGAALQEAGTSHTSMDASADADGGSRADTGDATRPDAETQDAAGPASAAHAFRAQTLLAHDGLFEAPVITASIQRVTLAGDETPELLVSEPALGQVRWLRHCGEDGCSATAWTGLGQPVRASPIDADGDGDTDVLVADIGSVPATPALVGRVLLLVNDGDFEFSRRQLWGGIGRVSCAEPGDFDGDGDVDVVVCEFGASDGSVTWLERKADNTYEPHEILRGAGAIEAVPHDVDEDGDVDIVVSLSQTFQHIALLRNDGGGHFEREVLWQATDDFGLVGLEATDLDQDGDLDFVVSGGDYFDETYAFEDHGVVWLEHRDGAFVPHRLAHLIGPHVTRAVDMDMDGDLDLAVATMRVASLLPEEAADEASLWWLENDGEQRFAAHPVGSWPAHTAALEVADFGEGPAWFAGSFSLGVAQTGDVPLGVLWPR